MNYESGWVFISHSHLDIDVVRKIRNKMEALGFNPLTFYLKCLSDDDEIEGLIKREIQEREWFVFVNSENSRRSHWVETERDYIEELGGKNICVINADSQDEQIDEILRNLTDHMRIRVIYHRNDRAYADQMVELLLSHDFSVNVSELDVPLTDPAQIRALADAQGGGFSLFVLTRQNLPSEACLKELDSISIETRRIILVVEESFMTDEETEIPSFGAAIAGVSGSVISPDMDEEKRERLYNAIRAVIKWNRRDFTTSYGFLSERIVHYPPIETIDDYTFSNCEALEEVFIPDTVVYISGKAFEGQEHVLVHCSPRSHAESFCRKHHMRYTTE